MQVDLANARIYENRVYPGENKKIYEIIGKGYIWRIFLKGSALHSAVLSFIIDGNKIQVHKLLRQNSADGYHLFFENLAFNNSFLIETERGNYNETFGIQILYKLE